MHVNVPKIGPMPAIGLGTWRLWDKECENSVRLALELGYRHIDTADLYANHASIAKAIKHFQRDQLFLVSKIKENDLNPNRVAPACERFLKELETPYLDLLLIHAPSAEIPSEQTLEAMVKVKEKNLVRHIGVSNFDISLLEKIQPNNFPILTNQIELHPYLQEEKLTDYCQKKGIIVTAYRPIQRGEVQKEELLNDIGKKYRKTPVQVVLRWLFQRNIVSIPKATSEKHLKENIEIFDFSLSSKEMQEISHLDQGKRFVFA